MLTNNAGIQATNDAMGLASRVPVEKPLEPMPFNPDDPMQNPRGAPMRRDQRQADEMAARERLMQIAAEAEAIVGHFPHLGQELMGGGDPVGVPGGMDEMPVAANTGPPMGSMPQGLIA